MIMSMHITFIWGNYHTEFNIQLDILQLQHLAVIHEQNVLINFRLAFIVQRFVIEQLKFHI